LIVDFRSQISDLRMGWWRDGWGELEDYWILGSIRWRGAKKTLSRKRQREACRICSTIRGSCWWPLGYRHSLRFCAWISAHRSLLQGRKENEEAALFGIWRGPDSGGWRH